MKQQPTCKGLVAESRYKRENAVSTNSKVSNTLSKSNKVAKIAHKLAELYRTSTSGKSTFVAVYKATALQLDTTDRRNLHRAFAEVVL